MTAEGRETDWGFIRMTAGEHRLRSRRWRWGVVAASPGKAPRTGERWRVNLFRCIGADTKRGIRMQPTTRPNQLPHPESSAGFSSTINRVFRLLASCAFANIDLTQRQRRKEDVALAYSRKLDSLRQLLKYAWKRARASSPCRRCGRREVAALRGEFAGELFVRTARRASRSGRKASSGRAGLIGRGEIEVVDADGGDDQTSRSR